MPPTDAINLTNLIPDIDGVRVRPGYILSHTLLSTSHQVYSLISWKTKYGERFYASSALSASDFRLYDISTTTPTLLKSGYVGGKWRAASMGGILALVNGGDQPQRIRYTPTETLIDDLPIGGTAPERFRVAHIFKSRSYWATGEEPAFWYSEINALGGALTVFYIDQVAETGGNVIDIRSWTRDGGSGPDDFFVLFLDTGEIIVYQGSNPGDANDWSLVGRYKLGRVLAATQFGGKIHVVSDEDYNTLPDDLLAEGLKQPTKLSGAARNAVAQDATDNWQILFDTKWAWRIINVPAGALREQHILNLKSGGACRFDIEAHCWARFRGDLYFGGADGKVYKIREGDDNGSAIEFSCRQAYTGFGNPQPMTVLNYRPVWSTNGNFVYDSGLSYDYDTTQFIQTHTDTIEHAVTTGLHSPDWDDAQWNTNYWAVGDGTRLDWKDGAGEGQVVSLFINGRTTKKAVWHHSDYRLDIFNEML